MSNNRLVQALYALGFADNLDSISRDRTIHQWAEAIETSPWLAAHDAAIRVGERAKIAVKIRASKANGDVIGDDIWNDGMERAARIAEGTGRMSRADERAKIAAKPEHDHEFDEVCVACGLPAHEWFSSEAGE